MHQSPLHRMIPRVAAALTLLTSLGGCGFGTAGILAGSGSGSGSTNGRSVASSMLVTRKAQSPCDIYFVLRDQEGDASDIEIGIRRAGEPEFRPVTLAAGSRPLSGVPDASAPYRLQWDFAADLGSNAYHDDVEVQVIVKGGVSPPLLQAVEVVNDDPSVASFLPEVEGAAAYTGSIVFALVVADSAGDEVSLQVEYNADAAHGYPDPAWKAAAVSPTAMRTTKSGSAGIIVWSSVEDLPGFDGNVELRLRAVDSFGATGRYVVTPPLRVDNNSPPSVVFEEAAFLLGSKDRGNIPLSFTVVDAESDPVAIVVQWRVPGHPWPALPTSPTVLRRLVDDPSLGAERMALQIGKESPFRFGGRFGACDGLQPDQVRLPELASAAAGLLASGLATQTVEVMRTTREPMPVAWSPNPLNGPVAAVAGVEGYSVLVLDSGGGSGWRCGSSHCNRRFGVGDDRLRH